MTFRLFSLFFCVVLCTVLCKVNQGRDSYFYAFIKDKKEAASLDAIMQLQRLVIIIWKLGLFCILIIELLRCEETDC